LPAVSALETPIITTAGESIKKNNVMPKVPKVSKVPKKIEFPQA
jgi:hypothetical protein